MRSKRFGERPFMVTAVINVIAPALIIGMIVSLVWFLVFAFYQGDFSARLMYVLGLYTFAAVLIARIAIDSGRAYAVGYLAAMGAAAMTVMVAMVKIDGDLQALSWVFNAALLGVIAYLADRIAFDCTMDDRAKQSLPEGLLQTLGLVKRPPSLAPIDDDDDEIDLLDPDRRGPKKRVKHNSGVWVLYFAILAVPLFGLGQLVIHDPAARATAFWFLFGYLAFALMLLMCTTFLSVRRYIRDRGMEMPREVIVRWLGGGAMAIVVILLCCILLPLPGRTLGVLELPFSLGSPDSLTASRYGWGQETTADQSNPDAAGVDQDTQADAPPGGASDQSGASESGSAQQDGKSAGPNASEKDSSARQSASQDSTRNENAAKSSKSPKNSESQATSDQQSTSENSSQADNSEKENNSTESPTSKSKAANQESSEGKSSPASTTQPPQNSDGTSVQSGKRFDFDPANFLKSISSSVASLAKWLTILVLVLFVAFYAITHPREIAALWKDLMALLALLFGWNNRPTSTPTAQPEQPTVERIPPARFSSFVNPFRSGERLTGSQIVKRSFAALEAWGAEIGVNRAPDETPREFVAKLLRVAPQLGKSPVLAANMLDQVVFANWKPKAADLTPLQHLWYAMTKLSVQATSQPAVPDFGAS